MMDKEDLEILAAAILEESNGGFTIYVDRGEIIINPRNIKKSTMVLPVNNMQVFVCCYPGYKQCFNIIEPDSIPKIAEAVDRCMRQENCNACTARFIIQ